VSSDVSGGSGIVVAVLPGRNGVWKRTEGPQCLLDAWILRCPRFWRFNAFTLPLYAKQIRQISQRNGIKPAYHTLRSFWHPETVYPPPAPPNPQIHVGYVSSDFTDHPLAHLMQSVFGMHDDKQYNIFGYALAPSDM